VPIDRIDTRKSHFKKKGVVLRLSITKYLAALVIAIAAVAGLGGASASADSLSQTRAVPTTPSQGTFKLVPVDVVPGKITPQSATKCTNGAMTCQRLVGSGLTVNSWTSDAIQVQETSCNIVATFKYNVTITNPGVWAVATFPGCHTMPAGGETLWETQNVGPVTFSGRTYVNVSWTNGMGTTPNAEIHS